MKVITLANQKGGVGKSTLTVNLVHSLKDKTPTYLVDFDLQGSSGIIKSNGYEKISTANFFKLNLKNDDGIVIIDTPPYLSTDYKRIISKSDLIIIPTKPTYFDLAATNNSIDTIIDIINSNKYPTKIGIIQNMVRANSTLKNELEEVVTNFQIPLFKTFITERVAYIRSVMLENGIYSTNDKKAQNEFNNFVNECLIFLTR